MCAHSSLHLKESVAIGLVTKRPLWRILTSLRPLIVYGATAVYINCILWEQEEEMETPVQSLYGFEVSSPVQWYFLGLVHYQVLVQEPGHFLMPRVRQKDEGLFLSQNFVLYLKIHFLRSTDLTKGVII